MLSKNTAGKNHPSNKILPLIFLKKGSVNNASEKQSSISHHLQAFREKVQRKRSHTV